MGKLHYGNICFKQIQVMISGRKGEKLQLKQCGQFYQPVHLQENQVAILNQIPVFDDMLILFNAVSKHKQLFHLFLYSELINSELQQLTK